MTAPGKLLVKLVAWMRSRVCKPPPLSGDLRYSRLAKAFGQFGSNQKVGDHLKAHQALVAQSARKIFESEDRP
ncbi:hypothetical protein ROS1_55470 [Roseibium sp. ROS1]